MLWNLNGWMVGHHGHVEGDHRVGSTTAFVLVVQLNMLVYWISACKLTRCHLLIATNNCANIFQVDMNKTEIVMIIAQWNFAVVYPTARVANTNTISDNN